MNKSNKSRLFLETLEERCCPAKYDFTGGMGGNSHLWATESNWSIGGVVATALPGSGDDVNIPAAKEVYFNMGANVSIKSLNILGGGKLNLGKVTAANLTLTVAGADSKLGDNTGVAANILSQNPGAVTKTANLVFSGATDTVEINNCSFLFQSINGLGALAGPLKSVTFANKQVNIVGTGVVVFEAVTTFGNGTAETDVAVQQNNTVQISTGDYGSLTVANASVFTVQTGGGMIRGAGNTNLFKLVGTGKLVIDVGAGNVYKIFLDNQAGVTGGKPTIKTGKLASVIQGDGATTLTVYAGGSLDSSGADSVFQSGDVINFVSDGVVGDDVTLSGVFDFNGSTENFDDATSFSVNLSDDDNGLAQWNGNGDTVNFAVNVNSDYSVTHATLNLSGTSPVFVASGGTFNVTTTGLTPVASTNVPLVTATTPLDQLFAGYSLGSMWSLWTPDSYTLGITSGSGTSGGGDGGGEHVAR